MSRVAASFPKHMRQTTMTDVPGLLDAFRNNPRTRHPAVLVRHDGSEDEVTITEYTPSGFRVAVSLRPQLGERVLIRVAGGTDRPALICWAHGGEAGGSH